LHGGNPRVTERAKNAANRIKRIREGVVEQEFADDGSAAVLAEAEARSFYALDVGACGLAGEGADALPASHAPSFVRRGLTWLAQTSATVGAALGIEADDER
jgi:hypothetical protein